MSAFIMSDDEISVIVSYFVHTKATIHGEGAWLKIGDKYDYLNYDHAAEVAKILKDENIRSVNARYNDDSASEFNFEYDPTAHKRPVGNIIGALDCLEYQSCETDDWETTNAYEIIQGLRKHLLKTIAEKEGTYTWGIQ